ncbi:DNA (cytosine-5-)-methyltransferase [Microbispora hainanensis]|uniref:DNA (cytosine-5-)-methyltransferase n=1 Tax=Microbispora hainanensis TaxID=568844 RepID=A0ABZ1SKT4_9ACTN|nr:DNA (cytosine-5-)-methyltransferase [Microbispora hainanensis]
MTLAPERNIHPLATQPEYRVAEFFAGIGLARMGLERGGFKVAWANDIDPNKAEMYRGHFGQENDHYLVKDIAKVQAEDLPGHLSLAWASFPCIDVSLAGNRSGLNGQHTGTFWGFIDILKGLSNDRPPVVALENVTGLATSHGGQDLYDTVKALNELGYSVDILMIDARHFVPQSRPRLFIVAAKRPPEDAPSPHDPFRPARLQPIFESRDLVTHRAQLPSPGPLLTTGLSEYVEKLPDDDPQWWSASRTDAFLKSLSPVQQRRLAVLRELPKRQYRTAYRRTRDGIPMWEIRADEIAGCLRTARGGSSKQALVQIDQHDLKVRWMTGREYANLMGARDYRLHGLRRNQELFGFGDAVCVDVVAWLAEHYLLPLVVAAMEPSPS